MRVNTSILMMHTFTSNPNNTRHLNSGFSILELLISVILLGLVMSVLFAAFFQISNSSLKVQSTLDARQELRLLMKIVLDDLQKVRYLKHFAESDQSESKQRETGLIADRILGPEDPETGQIGEVTSIDFHTSIKSRFFPENRSLDPELHEVSYSLQENPDTKRWEFIRREDFYIDNNLREGGKYHVLSEEVTKFELEFLESETALAEGGFIEKWTKVWDSDERKCHDLNVKEKFCLPRAVRLTMALKAKEEKTISDTQVINLCIPPCNKELFD